MIGGIPQLPPGRGERSNPETGAVEVNYELGIINYELTMKNLEDLKIRTKQLALRVIKLYCALPKRTEAQVIGKQVLRCGTSVGAQFREGTRAKSKADLISKLEGSLQELEETQYWFELLIESGIVESKKLAPLYQEAQQLTAILVTIVKTVKRQAAHNS
jgi:four helix bundle protein